MKRSVGALLLLLLVTPAWAQTARPRPKPDSKADAARVDPHAVLRAMEDAFSSVADRVTPAVVTVSAAPDRRAAGNDGEGDERFRQFFGDDLYERYFKRR